MEYLMKRILFISFTIVLGSVVFAQTPLRYPYHFTYVGAFRLPDGSGGSDWGYSGEAMTFFPMGDHTGLIDGYPGSLYASGHAWQNFISEFNIPVPVISATKNPEDLNPAATLRPFTDVRAGVGSLNVLQEIVRIGMLALPAQGAQTTPKLYLSWGAHFQEDAQNVASHMWCDMDFSNRAGAWRVGDISLYSVNDYMFEIPAAWADAHVQSRYIATGRFRDGGWSGRGPCIYAIAPWQHGNPPPSDAVLGTTKLLQYSRTYAEDTTRYMMTNYHNSDEWTGGAWLTAGDRSAVVFVGTKGVGDSCWYGNSSGPCLNCEERGWWSPAFQTQMIFYNPDDLAAVAGGQMEAYQPQPYAGMNLVQYMYSLDSANMKYRTGACAYDRSHGLFYMFEPTADGDKSLVHVWRLDPTATGTEAPGVPGGMQLGTCYPNPCSASAVVPCTLPGESLVTLRIYDMLGREVLRPVDAEVFEGGAHSKTLFVNNLPTGTYHVVLVAGGSVESRLLLKK